MSSTDIYCTAILCFCADVTGQAKIAMIYALIELNTLSEIEEGIPL